MRVVDYKKDTTTLAYQVIKGTGMVAGVFSLLVCCLIIANNLSIGKTDPIHSPALQRLVEQLKTNPKDEALRQEIRELDYLARRAFFTSQRFTQIGVILLAGGLVVMIVAFKSLEAYKTEPPYPDSSDPKDDIVDNARWARKAVTYAGLMLVGFALMIALPWESTLNIPRHELEAAAASAKQAASKPAASKQATSQPRPPTQPPASAKERLKNWPGFLGPESSVSQAKAVLTNWNAETGEGIRWKTPIPLPGFGSPIYWNGRIYLSGGNEASREVYCVNAESGEMLWTKPVVNIPGSPAEAPDVSSDTGYAAPTMATDGVRVFAIFSTGDLIALDLDGNQVWAKNLGVPDNSYGHSSSLVVHGNLLLVQFDQAENSFFAGFDLATGQLRWKTLRDFGASWASPALIDTGQRTEVILAADPFVIAYDPNNGKELWRCDCLERAEVAPTPVFANGLLYVSADYAKVSAIDVKSHEIVWENEELMPGVSTPLVVGGYLIGGLSDGGIACYDAKTGEELWYQETDDAIYASPLLIEGRVYLMERSGVMHIFKPGPTFDLINAPALDEEFTATPAAIGDSLYIRGVENLYRIGP